MFVNLSMSFQVPRVLEVGEHRRRQHGRPPVLQRGADQVLRAEARQGVPAPQLVGQVPEGGLRQAGAPPRQPGLLDLRLAQREPGWAG